MTDANTSKKFFEKCAVNHSILYKDVLSLLNVVVESFRVGRSVTDPETQLPKIYPKWLSQEFLIERSVDGMTPSGFYIHPLIKKRSDGENLRPNILTLQDIADLFKSFHGFIEEKIRKGEFTDVSVLNEQQLDLFNRLKADQNGEQIRIDLNFLQPDSVTLLSILATLGQNIQTEEKAPEVDVTLPDEFKALLEGELNLAVSWEWVKPFVEDVLNTEINARVAFFRYEGSRRGVSVVEVRFFLNTWLKRLYDQYTDRFLQKGTPLPESRLFDATNKFPLYFDLEVWVELDKQIAEFIATELSETIEEYQKGAGISVGVPGYQKKDTKDDEDKQKVTDSARRPEDIDDLLQKFNAAGKSYTDETNRLTTILLPQFFSMHGVRRDLVELSSIDRANFILVEREFRNELENVIRSLSPDELKLMSTRGGSLEFRLIVLRKLYGKLSTNPRFVGALNLYKENYVTELERRIAKGEPLQNEIDELNRRSNLPDDDFERDLERRERQNRNDWTRGATADTGLIALAEIADLHDITQRDFQLLLSRIAGDSIDSSILLRNLDVLIAERWSPERIRTLNAADTTAVFGLVLPDAITQNPQIYQLFISLCTEYLYARRQHLADHYQLDSISRDSGKPTDLTSLADAQNTAERYKDFGGGEALVVARASDTHRVNQYQSSIAAGVRGIHDETKQERQESVGNRRSSLNEEYESTTTIAGKRALLARLGVLTPELDDVNQTEDAQFALLNERFIDAINEDYADGMASLDDMSYYEDSDGSLVENVSSRGAIAQNRYGQPGARSLMKGSLRLHNKYATAQKRIDKAKKTLKKVRTGLSKAGKTAVKIVKSDSFKKGALAVALASLIDTITLMTQNGLSALLAVGGGALGGLVGFGLFPGSFLAGGIGFLGGALAGAHAGVLLTEQFPFLKDVFNFARLQLPSLGGASAVLPAATTTPLPPPPPPSSTPAFSLTNTSGINTVPAIAVVTTVAATVMTTVTTLSGALSPPPITTLNASGLESQYVIIRKVTSGESNFPGAVPSQITYQIYIQARDTYQLELVNFQDRFTIKTNSEKNSETPPALSCDSQLNMDTARAKIFTAADGEVLLGECTVPLTQAYHDSSINNEITIQFKVTQDGQELTNNSPNPACGENETTFCAVSALNVCLGECPAAQQGCWPTNGILTQPPYGDFSHSVVDAIDIAAPVGTPVYATFNGQAWAFDTYANEPSQQGHVFRTNDGNISRIYGKHIVLVTDQGFVLLYGHLNRHGTSMQLGQPVRVEAGTVVGYVGNSGSTAAFPMGNHLHYEYRIPSGGSWHSIIPGVPKDPLSATLPGNAPGEPFVYSEGMRVTSCYSESGNSP